MRPVVIKMAVITSVVCGASGGVEEEEGFGRARSDGGGGVRSGVRTFCVLLRSTRRLVALLAIFAIANRLLPPPSPRTEGGSSTCSSRVHLQGGGVAESDGALLQDALRVYGQVIAG